MTIHNSIIMKAKWSIYAAFILLVLGTIGCKQQEVSETSKNLAEQTTPSEIALTTEQLKQGNIETIPVAIESVNSTVTLNGMVDVPPSNMVSITCPLGGYVKNINLLPGQEVSRGEVLVTMEDPAYIQLQQDYLVSKSKLEFLEKEFSRQKQLSTTDATSKKNFEQVSADFAAEKANLFGLEQKLALLGLNAKNLEANNISRTITVRSPIHGFISKVPVNRGRYVNATEILAELVDPGDIHASLTVFEKDIPRIKKGQHVSISLVANPSVSAPGDVLLVTRNLDEKRTGLVHCHFDKYNSAFVPGMAVLATIQLERSMLPVVPESALLLYKGKHYVFVETKPNVFRLTEVIPGEKEKGMISLTNNNLDWKNTKVVSSGAFQLLGSIMKSEEEEH
jgi:cobalt-zinc-cadmium efflux system membrane fusion protein